MLMMNNIIRSAYRASDSFTDRYNILTICRNNEKYISLLCHLPHDFYIVNDHPWNTLIEARPDNVYTLAAHSPPLDFILCYDRAEQYSEAQNFAAHYHIPIVLVDMCSESLVRPQHIFENLQPQDIRMLHRTPAIRVCGSQHIQDSWNPDSIALTIPIGIDHDKFKSLRSPEDSLISLDNNTSSEVGAAISHHLGSKHTILPTDHENAEEITVNKTKYFINTNTSATVKLLEAMSSQNVVISLRNADTEDLIEHSKTGMLIDNMEELSTTVEFLEQNPDEYSRISAAARQYIIANHNLDIFVQKWSSVLTMMKSNFYLPTA